MMNEIMYLFKKKTHNCQLHNVISANRILGQITFNKDKQNTVDSIEVKVQMEMYCFCPSPSY